MAAGWKNDRDSSFAADSEFAGRAGDVRRGDSETRRCGTERRPNLLRAGVVAGRKRFHCLSSFARDGFAAETTGICEFSEGRMACADNRYEYVSASERFRRRQDGGNDREQIRF